MSRKIGYSSDIDRETQEIFQALAKRIIAEKIGWKKSRDYLKELCKAEALVVTPSLRQAAKQMGLSETGFKWQTKERWK